MAWSFSGCSLTVEIAPDSSLFAASPTWVDITSDVRSIPSMIRSGRTNELDATQPGTAEVIVNNRTRAYDPAYGPASVTFNGTGSNYFDAGDKAAFAAATQLDVRAALYLSDWSPATEQTIIGQYGAAGNRSWYVSITTAGYLQLVTSNDGTATTARDSGVRVSAVDGQALCVRVTWTNASTGLTSYYVKRCPVERVVQECRSNTGWIALGAADTGTTTTLFNSTAGVRVGERGDGTLPMTGRVYYASAAATIAGTPAVTFWPKDAASTSATSWTSSATGETWTGTGAAYVVRIQGTYYGRLLPGTPIRISATYSASTRRVWTGYIRRAIVQYPGSGKDTIVRLQCGDALAFLMDRAAPDSPIGIQVNSYGTTVPNYWPLHDAPASLQSPDMVGTAHARWSGYGNAGFPLQPWANVNTRELAVGIYANTSESATINSGTTNPYLFALVHIPDASAYFRVIVGDAITQYLINYGVGGAYYIQATRSGVSEVGLIDGRLSPGVHLLKFQDTSFAVSTTYLTDSQGDISAWANISGALTDISGFRGVAVGGAGATVSDVFVYNATGIDATDLNRTALTGRSLETAGPRMTWLLTAAGIPGGLQSVTTDVSTYLGPSGAGGSYGSLAQQVNAAEQGRLYVTGAGVVTFTSRLWKWTNSKSTTSQATFSDSFADITVDPASVDQVQNAVTVSAPQGWAGYYTDATSTALYGVRSASYSAPCASPGDAQSLAQYIVGLRAHPRVRVSSVTLLPRSNPATLFPQVLDRDIGDRITVTRNVTGTLVPATTTEPVTADVWIEGIQHSVDAAGNWSTTWLTVPAGPSSSESGYLTLDDSVLGNLDAGLALAP